MTRTKERGSAIKASSPPQKNDFLRDTILVNKVLVQSIGVEYRREQKYTQQTHTKY